MPYSTTNKNTIQIHSDNLDFHGPVIPFTKDLFQIRGESEREYMAETSNECARPTPLWDSDACKKPVAEPNKVQEQYFESYNSNGKPVAHHSAM